MCCVQYSIHRRKLDSSSYFALHVLSCYPSWASNWYHWTLVCTPRYARLWWSLPVVLQSLPISSTLSIRTVFTKFDPLFNDVFQHSVPNPHVCFQADWRLLLLLLLSLSPISLLFSLSQLDRVYFTPTTPTLSNVPCHILLRLCASLSLFSSPNQFFSHFPFFFFFFCAMCVERWRKYSKAARQEEGGVHSLSLHNSQFSRLGNCHDMW